MILNEDFRNLKVLDNSILNKIDLKNEENISIDSKIYIDKVKDPHSFSHVIEILQQDNVAAIIFRTCRRQMCMVVKYGNSFKVYYSDYTYYHMNNDIPTNSIQYVSTTEELKRIISKLFLNITNDETVKKVWDILVIEKDDKSELRKQRVKSREGRVLVPSDTGNDIDFYKMYIDDLKYKLKDRLVKFKEEKLPNLTSKKEILNFFISDEHMQKIKIEDSIFILSSRNYYYSSSIMEMTYNKIKGNAPFGYIKIEIIFKGIYPSEIKIHTGNVSYSINDEYNMD